MFSKNIRVGLAAFALVLALPLGGCDLPTLIGGDIKSLEASAAAAVVKLKANYATFKQNLPQYVERAKALGQIVCGVNGLVGAGIVQVQQNVDGASANFTANLNAAKKYDAAVASACDRIASTQAAQPTGSNVADLALSAWNGYVAAKAKLQAAVASAQPGTAPQ